jgi:dipeptidyl-peptidase-4
MRACKRRFVAIILFLTILAIGCAGVERRGRSDTAQPAARGSRAPVDRAGIRAYAETRGFRNGTPVSAIPTPDGKSVLFLRSGPRDAKQSLYELDLASGQTRELVSADAATKGEETIFAAERARRERLRISAKGITSFELTDDGGRVLIGLSGRLFVLTRANNELKEIPVGSDAYDPHFSHDGKRIAFVQKNDLFTVGVDTRDVVQATRGGTEAKPHGVAEFVAQEELDRTRGFWWSPDGTRILFEEADCTKVDELTITDPSMPEREPDRTRYPRAGRNNCEPRFGIVPWRGGPTTWVDLDTKRFPYVATVTWSRGAPPTLYAIDRLQRTALLLAVDPQTGRTTTLVEERDAAWINVDPSVPKWLPDGSGFLWSSDREGGPRLELRDAKGAIVRSLTGADLGYRALLDVDAANKRVVVSASSEPASSAVWSVPLEGGAPAPIGRFDKGGVVTAQFGEGHDVFVQMEATLTTMPRWFARTMDGKGRWEIPSVAEAPAALPNVQIGTVGSDQVRVAIVRPRSFDPKRKYAVIDAAYGGPGVTTVVNSAAPYLRAQWLADATDAILVHLDARGTPHRGRDWERVLSGKLGQVPLEGHVATLRALAAAMPEMDLGRLGIYGWSFGGYLSALAVLVHPEMFKVAVAGAPPADWRDYDTCYTERYLGLPSADASAYDAASLLVAARNAPSSAPPRPMLVVHGTSDDNVYFTNSLKLTDALARAGRPFELMPLVGVTHQLVDPKVSEMVWVRAASFLREHLD